jgi:hypothetical protein
MELAVTIGPVGMDEKNTGLDGNFSFVGTALLA